ncbi:hypothetical protein [Micromonospora sp. WMMD736]|uniref:hypothetical protein n=1 Tax=Micromonospora sp. WMMD736 TaxID=3404112 RepID=UPI003B932456
MTITTLDINIDTWIILDVCSTCYWAVGGSGEINDVLDARSAEALDVKWQDYHMWVDCGGDGCDSEHRWMCVYEDCDDPNDEDALFGHSHEYGHHSGGFTRLSCDVCGGGGHDSHRVIAEKLDSPPEYLNVAVSHEITAGDLVEGDKILKVDGIAWPVLVEAIDYTPGTVFAKLVDPLRESPDEYISFLRETPATVLFAASC